MLAYVNEAGGVRATLEHLALRGTSAPALTLHMASIPPMREGPCVRLGTCPWHLLPPLPRAAVSSSTVSRPCSDCSRWRCWRTPSSAGRRRTGTPRRNLLRRGTFMTRDVLASNWPLRGPMDPALLPSGPVRTR
ncbi:hypothetical protein D7X32_09870 [Corallococcus carmarthensis]|uniref:Uncharacterized protein n=1 Tax=Corallococcus carmarthensis TaxID=2316728 RepID=A0A3A8KKX3_9BACT|nr:hypothetical protein D7X32_09870 [Corallococcus carmarthensis]